MKKFRSIQSLRRMMATAGISLALVLAPGTAFSKEKFRMAWTLYAGWMPWAYAADNGIIDKWADKYDLEIEVVQLNDYIEAINQFTAGTFDAATMANMDALTIPAVGGVDTTVLVLNDYSDGNDTVILKNADELADIEGRTCNIVELSVSHYFLARVLEEIGMSERDLTLVNTSDADMAAAFATPATDCVVTWNPMSGEILERDDAVLVADSSQIPGEIQDMTMIRTEVFEEHPEFAKAMVGAWYETMEIMTAGDAMAEDAKTFMGERAGTDLAGYQRQLDATRMFYTPQAALDFITSPDLPDLAARVAQFSFDKGLYGAGASDAMFIGIEFPDGSVWGNEDNVKIRYNDSILRQAVKGEL